MQGGVHGLRADVLDLGLEAQDAVVARHDAQVGEGAAVEVDQRVERGLQVDRWRHAGLVGAVLLGIRDGVGDLEVTAHGHQPHRELQHLLPGPALAVGRIADRGGDVLAVILAALLHIFAAAAALEDRDLAVPVLIRAALTIPVAVGDLEERVVVPAAVSDPRLSGRGRCWGPGLVPVGLRIAGVTVGGAVQVGAVVEPLAAWRGLWRRLRRDGDPRSDPWRSAPGPATDSPALLDPHRGGSPPGRAHPRPGHGAGDSAGDAAGGPGIHPRPPQGEGLHAHRAAGVAAVDHDLQHPAAPHAADRALNNPGHTQHARGRGAALGMAGLLAVIPGRPDEGAAPHEPVARGEGTRHQPGGLASPRARDPHHHDGLPRGVHGCGRAEDEDRDEQRDEHGQTSEEIF